MDKSIDGITVKYLYGVEDGQVETTHVNRPEKHIICFSTQLGCPVGCAFCVSSHPTRFRRNLTVDEMLGQVTKTGWPFLDNNPVLFSAMGEGEPLLNFDNVVETLQCLGQAIPKPKLALSTSGVRPSRIRKLAMSQFPSPFKLQISLHTAFNRSDMMPKVLDALPVVKAGHDYQQISGRSVEWNVVLLYGINDTPYNANRVAGMLQPGDVVKLNRYNSFPGSPFTASNLGGEYAHVLKSQGLVVEEYATDGKDIQAACGQLSWKKL